MLTVRSEVIVNACNEHVVVELGRGAENVPGIIQAVSRRNVVGRRLTSAESPVKITRVIDRVEHRGIDPDAVRVKQLKLRDAPARGSTAISVHILKVALAH